MERIKSDTWTKFTSMEFQEGFSVYGVQLELAAQHNREMNGKFEVI